MSKTITISVSLELDAATIDKIARLGFIDSKTGNHIGMGSIVAKCRRYADHRNAVLTRIDDNINFTYEFGDDGKMQTYLFPKGQVKGPAIKVLFDDGRWYYTVAPRVHYDRVVELFEGAGESIPYKSQWLAIHDASDILMGKLEATI